MMDSNTLEHLGLSIDDRRKWPDVMLYEPRGKKLFLFEVHGARGPISTERREEMKSLFAHSKCECIYVSVFPGFDEYRRHARKIGWNTSVWLSKAPKHVIHHNGIEHLYRH